MNLRLLPWTRPQDAPARAARLASLGHRAGSRAAGEAAARLAAEEQEDIPPRGCAWFESSRELDAGLLVTEHDSPDRVANQLPLEVWLEWQFPGARPAQPMRPA